MRKPWSSDRCKSKNGNLRCRDHRDHEGQHSARQGKILTVWA